MSAPEYTSVEAWARGFVLETKLERKVAPSAVPAAWDPTAKPERLDKPGRPPELRVIARAPHSPRAAALSDPRQRARLLHTFWHHELQAAELMCWALLAFAGAEPEFRQGLLRVAGDEIRHMGLYQAELRRLGFDVGSFEVRDWFWQRVPSVRDPIEFVALMGMGLEGANLEHAPKFAEQFRAAGDDAGAAVQERIAADEVAHVRFATTWFRRWTGDCRFEDWRARLPQPLSPLLMRGDPIRVEARRAAGMPDDFVSALAAWQPDR